ncbi:MAG: UbiA family prenyltransferase [Anaerolineaceae bacterium]|nr:UbiA family prenyltransferase [Anaerolineaceae bacterium]
MKNTILGLLKLTRFNEYVYFVIVTTLLGVAAAAGQLGWQMVVVVIANWFAVGFAFMINDVEDAPDDALSDNKIKRNPVSAGLITPKTARIASFTAAVIALGLFTLLGWKVFIIGLSTLILGFIYSQRGIRLKTIAFFDLISHCLMLAGLQFLTGYFTFLGQFNDNWYFPFLFVVCVSLYGELFNEMRDIEGDREAQLRHTAIVLGEKKSHIIMIGILSIGVLSGGITFFFLDILPGWVVILMAILAVIFIVPTLLRVKKTDSSLQIQAPTHKPLERAGAIALLMQFIIPVLVKLFTH